MYMGVRNLEYTLRGKFFIHETDNKNMLFFKSDQSHMLLDGEFTLVLSCLVLDFY